MSITRTYNVSGYIEKIREEHGKIQKVKAEKEELILKLCDVLEDTIKQFAPLIKEIKDLGYTFKHRETDYLSTIGPILFVDRKDNIVCFLDLDDEEGKLVNLTTNNKPVSISYYEIIEQGHFEKTIASIQNVSKNIDNILNNEKISRDKLKEISIKY